MSTREVLTVLVVALVLTLQKKIVTSWGTSPHAVPFPVAGTECLLLDG